MNEQQYYEEIEHLIKKNEISKRVRKLEENYSLVETYWHIGKIIVEAQGGSKRAKYGNELIKKWSIKLTNKYGKGYDATNLSRFRKFYLYFPKIGPLGQLSWSHYRTILDMKNPIIIPVKNKVTNEHDLELNILANLNFFFR